jgi:hypothetical protein
MKMKIIVSSLFSAFLLASCDNAVEDNSTEKNPEQQTTDANARVAETPASGLVAHYTFQGGTATDLAGSNNGTITGAVSVADRNGQSSEAFQFNSSDDVIKVSAPSFLSNTQGTFAAWVKFSSLNTTQYVGGFGDEQSILSYLSLVRLDPGTKTLGIYQREATGANWLSGSTIIQANTYYFVALTSNGSSWTLYINGVPETLTIRSGTNTGKWIGHLPGIDNFTIGNVLIQPPYAIPYLNGNIDEVWLYNRVLTDCELRRMYAEIPKNGLIARYTFQSGTATDIVGGFNGTITGATLTTDRFGTANEAFHFDNPSDNIKVSNPSFLSNLAGTFAAWVKFDSLNKIQYVGSVGDEQSTTKYLSLARLDPGTKTFSIYQRNGSIANWITASTVIQPDTYYFVTMTSDGSTWSIYVNGNKETLTTHSGANTGTWFGHLSGLDNFGIGNMTILSPYDIPNVLGNIDDVLLYNRALTDCEVKQLYNATR